MKNKLIIIIYAIILIFLMLGNVSAADRDVGPGKTYNNVSAAITAASPGDNINVYDNNGAPITYHENVIVSQDHLNINAIGDVTISPVDDNEAVFSFEGYGNASSINNFKIEGKTYNEYGGSYYGWMGIWVGGSSDVTLSNNHISGFYYGIESSHSSTTQILTNHIFDNFLDGIMIVNSEHTTIMNNIIENNQRNGINLWGDQSSYANSGFNEYSEIIGNTIQNNPVGILNNYTVYSTIRGNLISNNEIYGIQITNSDENAILSNTICNNGIGIGVSHTTFMEGVLNRIGFNRIVYNTEWALVNENSLVDATCNWWGSNENPYTISNKIKDSGPGGVMYIPWIILKAYLGPTLPNSGFYILVGDLTYKSDGWQMDYLSPQYLGVPTSTLVEFSADQGEYTTPKFINEHSTARSTLIAPLFFSGIIHAWVKVDDQIIPITINVASKTPQFFNPNASKFFNQNLNRIIALTIGVANQNITNNSNQSSGNSENNSGANGRGSSSNTNTIIFAILTLIIIGGGGYWLFARK